MKRKRGAAGAQAGPSSPGPATRRRRRLALAVANTLMWVRNVAAGTLWTTPDRDRDLAEEERMREEFLDVRRRTYVSPSDPKSPYLQKKSQKISTPRTRSSDRIARKTPHTSSYLVSRKDIGTDPIECHVSVPDWKAPSEEDIADYKNDVDTIFSLGEVVCSLNMDTPPAYQLPQTRNARADKCNCQHPGSEACVRVHVNRAKCLLRNQLGKKVFRSFGLDAMGEEVLRSWTKEEKKKLGDIEKLVPQNKHSKFMQIALEQFSSKKQKDLTSYYYNVFLPRRLASVTRAETTNAKDDGINEDHSEKKRASP
ncbi:hypothetical protein GUJ93_ZPchr0013g36810 [Zizania palustris]|uniref:ELM2 domain-containing protein n=1 Tax=Zizania palustris TaxID=103762 RepID=A0A8J6C3T4_ZIZPA|nr:hypothetical protein GUJ93_ZPchr0013g36810 [Zizania palustris]KAG8098819.1 hypothetical protein GUJ93_ZPchr0013g36810 [Zizania palustris]